MSYQTWNTLMWVFLALGIVLAVAAAVFFKVARVRQARAALQGKGVEEEVRRLRAQRVGSWSEDDARGAGPRHPGAKYTQADEAASVQIRSVSAEIGVPTDSGLHGDSTETGATVIAKSTLRGAARRSARASAGAAGDVDESATSLRAAPAAGAAGDVDESATSLRAADRSNDAPGASDGAVAAVDAEAIDSMGNDGGAMPAAGRDAADSADEDGDEDEGETVLWRDLPHDSDITNADEALTRLMGTAHKKP